MILLYVRMPLKTQLGHHCKNRKFGFRFKIVGKREVRGAKARCLVMSRGLWVDSSEGSCQNFRAVLEDVYSDIEEGEG